MTSPAITRQTSRPNVLAEPSIDTHVSGTGMQVEQPLHDPLAGPEQQVGSEAVAGTQEAAEKGFYLSLFIPYTSIRHVQHGTADHAYLNSLDGGPGFGVRAGYPITARVSLEWSLSTTWHGTSQRTIAGSAIEDQLLNGTELDVKFHLPLADSRLEPYLLGGIGYAWLGDDISTSDTHYRGREIQAGFGAEYHLPHQLSVFAGITRKRIVFNSGQWIGAANIKVNAATLDIGITYHFE